VKKSQNERQKNFHQRLTLRQKRYRNILTRGENEMPPIPTKSKGKRGRIAKSDAHNL
jgi:transposase